MCSGAPGGKQLTSLVSSVVFLGLKIGDVTWFSTSYGSHFFNWGESWGNPRTEMFYEIEAISFFVHEYYSMLTITVCFCF